MSRESRSQSLAVLLGIPEPEARIALGAIGGFIVEPVQAGDVKPGDTIWAPDDGDWLDVDHVRGDFTLEFHRRDSSVAEFDSEQTVLRREA